MELKTAWRRVRSVHPAVPVVLFGISFIFVPAIESSVKLPLVIAWVLAIEFFISAAWFMVISIAYVWDLIRSYDD
ncbi:hypothetical protein GCM10009762_02460 [Dermacoccus barathri]|uniref:DUF3311 domain-containing protein n=1 Tax=Dermacoccus barathri TaxID=322601 RepID=A0ABN2B1A8_9MICO